MMQSTGATDLSHHQDQQLPPLPLKQAPIDCQRNSLPPPPPKHLDSSPLPYKLMSNQSLSVPATPPPAGNTPSIYSSTGSTGSLNSLPIPPTGAGGRLVQQQGQQGQGPPPRSPTPSGGGGSTRASSIMETSSVNMDQLLDHSHLKPGSKASLLSYQQTINMYRENAKKTNSPDIQCDFAIFMVEAAKPLLEDDTGRWEYLLEAEKLLKQLASRGHSESQYYLGNLYASGLLSRKGKNEFDKAFPLFVQATKHHHADAAYRYCVVNIFF